MKAVGKEYRQGYLVDEKNRVVRIRTIGDLGLITIKGEYSGYSRPEFEYEIPVDDAVGVEVREAVSRPGGKEEGEVVETPLPAGTECKVGTAPPTPPVPLSDSQA